MSETPAEKFEQVLRGRGKVTEITIPEAELLLSHPLLVDLIGPGGNHLYVVTNPYVKAHNDTGLAEDLANALECPAIKRVIMSPVFPIQYHKNRLQLAYVAKLLDFIETRRKVIASDLEEALKGTNNRR